MTLVLVKDYTAEWYPMVDAEVVGPERICESPFEYRVEIPDDEWRAYVEAMTVVMAMQKRLYECRP